MHVPAALARFLATRPCQIVTRVVSGTWIDGFVLAGNLAYLSLLTLFPFFIVVATIAGAFGRTEDGIHAVNAFMRTVPPDVGKLIAAPVRAVLTARSGKGLVTLGILVTLWTVSGFIETIREIIRKAYGTNSTRPVWEYRVGAIALIVGAVFLMVIAFIVQVVMTGIEQFIVQLLPFKENLISLVGLGRIAPALALFGSLWGLFYALTPRKFRDAGAPVWPGALLIAVVWIGTTMLLPVVLSSFGSYDRTYGSLAGVIVALLFFYIIGFGVVIGAQLNAALAIVPKLGQKAATIEPGQGVDCAKS
ncbi:YihY/virulence factor BrkB family protein [Polymorphobacter sp. PAMC 29334]|uniref:YihY/virulence factor BrkB family protein n=1 Tax=Polymorphobacter sp. PAMC 29334 TaxID=2862331 RepID=UPI001C668CDF|nr:YihY/virulence factor BrkB family protein [Polymorphobacter sp. PAMC 29334]QYE34468.1 YihY/virulence factor BrkB family protein [Polymorphobacter sp. PAMC 29334]